MKVLWSSNRSLLKISTCVVGIGITVEQFAKNQRNFTIIASTHIHNKTTIGGTLSCLQENYSASFSRLMLASSGAK